MKRVIIECDNCRKDIYNKPKLMLSYIDYLPRNISEEFAFLKSLEAEHFCDYSCLKSYISIKIY